VQDWLGLTGKRVLVVGAGGIGGACASGFVAAGAKVVVADRDEVRLKELADELSLVQQGGATIPVDLTQPGACGAVVDQAVELLGGIDVFLHAVGTNDRRPILEFTDEEWDRVVSVNLTTAFRLGRRVGELMTVQGSGRLVFLSSVSGLLAHKNHGPYAASKGGLNQMLRVMAAEWASKGVTVNAVAPGYVETPLTQGHLAKPGVRDELVRLVPAGRLGVASEVVGPALFLSSHQAGFVTGQVLYVDGGRTLV
jgi:NAD(P)-dependent dehydrogenase (short-subunit alcohol dehydrogenase family)